MTSDTVEDALSLPRGIIKRDGSEASFDPARIERAVLKAGNVTREVGR